MDVIKKVMMKYSRYSLKDYLHIFRLNLLTPSPFLQKLNHLTRGILKFLIFLWAPISYIAYRLSCIGLL